MAGPLELRRLCEILAEPVAKLFQSDFLKTGKAAGGLQSGGGVKNTQRDFGSRIDLRDGKSQIHRNQP